MYKYRCYKEVEFVREAGIDNSLKKEKKKKRSHSVYPSLQLVQFNNKLRTRSSRKSVVNRGSDCKFPFALTRRAAESQLSGIRSQRTGLPKSRFKALVTRVCVCVREYVYSHVCANECYGEKCIEYIGLKLRN